jgi:curved DNA-binding protein CbpA
LPDGVPLLLKIAAGDADAEREACRLTDRPREVIRKAAVFFIEQILLHADADNYRVLGASPQSTGTELRQNMALLVKWLHPDLDRDAARSVLAKRVTLAWDAVKTPERKAAYDKARSVAANAAATRAASRARRHDGAQQPASAQPSLNIHRAPRKSFLRRGLLALWGGPRR